MGGSVKFEDALKMRLAVMNTSSKDIENFLAKHPPRISQGNLSLEQHCRLLQTSGAYIIG